MENTTLPLTAQLLQHIQQVNRKSKHLPFTEWAAKPNPAKWSKKEILGHLIDSASYNLMRFTEAPLSNEPYVVQKYQQALLVRIKQYQQQPIGQLVERWTALNRQVSLVWNGYSAANWLHPVVTPDVDGLTSLKWLADDYIRHLAYHLDQIFSGELNKTNSPYRITIEDALGQLKSAHPVLFTKVMEHGSMLVEIYQPEKVDLQTPHTRDELYIIIKGEGWFVNGESRHLFCAGDVLFVPAGVVHRFEEFSDDFLTWVVFYGPEGGESN